jgi:tetratricopeptide (TPR) repeat protein
LIHGEASAQEKSYDELFAAAECGPIENAYGPYDYANPSDYAEKLPIVEAFHFNKNVESLKAGMTAELPGGDLDYTLRAFPNHHRALYSMGRYALSYPNDKVPPGAYFSGDCYFERAIRFRPDDPVVRLVFGIFLSKSKKYDEAIEQLKKGQELDDNNPEIHYNMGLVYEKSGQDQLALQHAKLAYGLGYPLPGLRNILKRKGVWTDG